MIKPFLLAVRSTYMVCSICNRGLEVDDAKMDEPGRVVHKECYAQKLSGPASGRQRTPVPDNPNCGQKSVRQELIEFLDGQAARPVNEFCAACGSPLEHRETTFFYEGRTWKIHLTTCLSCDPIPKNSVV